MKSYEMKTNKIYAESSVGDLIDRITILEIKKTKIVDQEKLKEVNKEHNSLINTMNKVLKDISKISKFKEQLKSINLKLWDIEDGKRLAEKNNDFGSKFIELARNVYKYNDERAKIKSKINEALNSNIKEVKSYF